MCHHLLSVSVPHLLSSPPYSGQGAEAQAGKSPVFPRLPQAWRVVIELGSEPTHNLCGAEAGRPPAWGSRVGEVGGRSPGGAGC